MIVIPAILEKTSDDAMKLLQELSTVTSWVQIDFADGTMTESVTCDLFDLADADIFCDVEIHLMTTNPEKYFDACAALGAKRVYFHLGEVESPSHILTTMDPFDFTKGITLSPQTSVEDVFTYIDEIDAVQVMTVVPGAQGAQFLPVMLEKVAYLRERRNELWIGVDGGVNETNIIDIGKKGVDAVGVGSAITRADNPIVAYQSLVSLVAS